MKFVYHSILVSAIFLIAGCSAAPLISNQPSMDTSTPAPQGRDQSWNDYLSTMVGKPFEVDGQISKAIGQHMAGQQGDYLYVNYVDTGELGQLVVYTKTPVTEQLGPSDYVRFSGTLIRAEGSSEPGAKESVAEYQILADDWHVLEAGGPNL